MHRYARGKTTALATRARVIPLPAAGLAGEYTMPVAERQAHLSAYGHGKPAGGAKR